MVSTVRRRIKNPLAAGSTTHAETSPRLGRRAHARNGAQAALRAATHVSPCDETYPGMVEARNQPASASAEDLRLKSEILLARDRRARHSGQGRSRNHSLSRELESRLLRSAQDLLGSGTRAQRHVGMRP